MLGAIAGDIIGSPFEFSPIKSTHFPLFSADSTFTDDTVLTIAVADAAMHDLNPVDTLKDYFSRYPERGYGGSFARWARSERSKPYNSWGNGSAMRTSSIGWLFNSKAEVLHRAKAYAEITHNHSEGIRGAQATALAILMARQRATKAQIQREISAWFHYNLDKPVDAIRETYIFDVSCQGSVPQSIICFLESDSYDQAVRLAVSLGGDADTMACIAGGIAEAFYGFIPEYIAEETRARLPGEFLSVLDEFAPQIRKIKPA